jgi:hypothetical protein
MTPVTAGKVKYGVWGLICGAIIATILGFAWGGWTTRGTTQRMGEEAVLAARAAICVAQFMKDPNYQEHLQVIGKNWLRVSDTAERSQVDQRICHQLHAIVPLLDTFKAEQQSLELVFPGKGALDAHP